MDLVKVLYCIICYVIDKLGFVMGLYCIICYVMVIVLIGINSDSVDKEG
jgi:hypothetical protein